MKKETKRLIAAGLIALLGAGVAYADDTLDRTVTANFPEETDAYKNDKTVTNKFINKAYCKGYCCYCYCYELVGWG